MIRSPLPFLCLAALSLVGCQNDKPKFTLSVHSESSEMESPRSIMPDMVGNPPRKVILARSPEFSHNNIAAYHSFPAENGNANGVSLRLDFKGTQALELVTRMRQGEILRSIVNGKGADYVVIDRPISDGIFTIWEGVPDEVIAEMAKKYPPISGLKSASANMEMTPSTKTEKKKAFRFFKKSEREAESSESKKEDKKTEKEEAAAIQAPDIDTPALDPLLPLPAGSPQ
jgi:hypothetical protein